MLIDFGVLSYAAATLAFVVISLLLATAWEGRLQGALLLAACVMTIVWSVAAAIAAYFLVEFAESFSLQVLEILRQLTWILFLLRLLSVIGTKQKSLGFLRVCQFTLIGITVMLFLLFPLHFSLSADQIMNFRYTGHLVLAFIGLVLIEQIHSNLKPERRWAFKFLTLSIGGLFAYEFYLYSDALLFRRMDLDLWNARGFINAMVVPLIAVSAARNPDWSVDVFVSRGIVFHSAAIFGSGIYLLAMVAGGYYVRYYGGNWGHAVQAAFLFGALLLLLSLLSSGQVQARLRVFINKHFFNYKYDYRDEWLRFIQTLEIENATTDQLRENAIAAVASIVDSPRAILMGLENDRYRPAVYWNAYKNDSLVVDKSDPLVSFLRDSQWIINVNELKKSPEKYRNIDLPSSLQSADWLWLIIPMFYHRTNGILLLWQSRADREINWEDRDVLKVAVFQVANYLSLLDASEELAQVKQFEAFHQFSAFVIHDLKNLVAQLSLVVTNARKHRNNPDFMQDAIATVDNSVRRMTHLLEQLKDGRNRQEDKRELDLASLLKSVVQERQLTKPMPVFKNTLKSSTHVMADEQRLKKVFIHLVQNAQEATAKEGSVIVRLTHSNGKAVVDIEDTGVGMNEEFIRQCLFRPFESTKGLTGMGIGAYESKIYVEAIGGGLQVQSIPGKGTSFRLELPCTD